MFSLTSLTAVDVYSETAGMKITLPVNFTTGTSPAFAIGFSSVDHNNKLFPAVVTTPQKLTPVKTDLSDGNGELISLQASAVYYVYWIISGSQTINVSLRWINVKGAKDTDVFIVKNVDTVVSGNSIAYGDKSATGSSKIGVSTIDLIDEPYDTTYTLALTLEATTKT